jgi:hypothetical protein
VVFWSGPPPGAAAGGGPATRLLWALGFGVDALYPVRVVCRGCPARFAAEGDATAEGLRFDIAAIEQRMAGAAIESHDRSGWAWPELDLVDPSAGGAPQAQRDALKLLGVMIQHTDSKAEQQRLLCPPDHHQDDDLARCQHPFLMIHDVGQPFGAANVFNRTAVGSVNLAAWRHVPVWKDRTRCRGNLSASFTGTLSDPLISESGRQFLADLFEALSDEKIGDLFEVARFTRRPTPDGHVTTLAEWVDAFRQKRQDIVSARCPT